MTRAIPLFASALKDVLALVELADSHSARQMLLSHHLNFGQPHPDHERFFQEIQSFGNFPSAPGLRSVAIASGAGTGAPQHYVEGVTWQIPIPVITHTVPINILDIWKTSVTFGFTGKVIIRLVPLTQTRQAVLRLSADGPVWINGTVIATGGDTLTSAGITTALVNFLRIPDWVGDDLLASILAPAANSILNFFQGLLQPLAAAATISTITPPFPYESLAGGLSNEYGTVAELFEGIGGSVAGGRGSPSVFIPTYSALASNHLVGADLTTLPSISTPFNEVVYQSRDLLHTSSESDVICRETRRLGGYPYVTRVEPANRVVGMPGFTLRNHRKIT